MTEVYVICDLDDIPTQRARSFNLLRVGANGAPEPWTIVVVRWGRKVFGYVNRCPHDGTKLDWERNQFLDPSGNRLMCGKHGAQFELGTGRCIEGPCRGDHLEPVAVCLIDDEICLAGVDLVEDEAETDAGVPVCEDAGV